MLTLKQIKLLIIEDDDKLRTLMAQYFAKHECQVTTLPSGEEAISQIKHKNPHVVILDINLPGQNGFEICKSLRPDYQGHIIMLTARDEPYDNVLGLEIGADDYLIKPTELRVILAKINTYIRRQNTQQEPSRNSSCLTQETTNKLSFGRLQIHPSKRKAFVNDTPIALTDSEFELLHHLALSPGTIQSRASILQATRGIDYDGFNRSVDSKIVKIRKKLSEAGLPDDTIASIRGKGYSFQPE